MKIVSLVIFGLLSIIALGATIIPFFPSKQWYVRIFDYPRLQTFMIAAAALAWYYFFFFKAGPRGYVFGGMCLIVLIIQGYKAWPYTPFAKKQVLNYNGNNHSAGVSLFICNVLQTNNNYGKVIEEADKYDPDIIITTESDNKWEKALSPLEKEYKFKVAVPQNNTYGMHLYSKLKLQDSEVRYIIDKEIPSIKTKVQLQSGEWITLFIVHPPPPVPSEAPDSKERDAELILVGKEAKKVKGGVIVAGDFNDVAWSETTELFQEVTGFLDPRRGRGFYNTYHAGNPLFRWPLDHIFHSNHFRLVKIKRGGKTGSDHFPMFINLSYDPDNIASQPEVPAEKNTEEKVQKTIEKGDEAKPMN